MAREGRARIDVQRRTMIELCATRGTPEYRAARRNTVSASDARAFMAGDGTQARRALVERIVLDREGVDDHTVEHPDPWIERQEQAIVAARAAYARDRGIDVLPGGLYAHEALSWLVASPHGVTDAGAILCRPRTSLRSFISDAGSVDRVWRVRSQLTAFVVGVAWVDVVDFWDGLGRVPDRLTVHREVIDAEWIASAVLPRLVSLWDAVRVRLRDRAQRPTSG